MTTRGKLALLALLYFVQGLPFGILSLTLPVRMRELGASLKVIGFLGLLQLPWVLKFLWAPLVDRFWSASYGRRKSWIVPLQLAMAGCACAAALRAEHLAALIACVTLMNLFAATQDVAVDGLAVDLLSADELGRGNALQVVGYKLGMIASSGALVWLALRHGMGFADVMWGMACLVVLVCGAVALWEEPPSKGEVASPSASPGGPLVESAPGEAQPGLREVLGALRRAVSTRAGLWLIVFLVTYRVGESCVDAMWKPYLVDSGFDSAQIAAWVSTWGTVAGLLGSLAGGWLVGRLGLWRALLLTGVVRCAPLLAEAAVAATRAPTQEVVVAITILEHVTSGLFTTATFAFMMSRVDRSIGASHYTLLASIEVLGKSPGTWASGALAEWLGYAPLFLLGAIASLLPLAALLPLRPGRDHRSAAPVSGGV